jgi:hypothetical protein
MFSLFQPANTCDDICSWLLYGTLDVNQVWTFIYGWSFVSAVHLQELEKHYRKVERTRSKHNMGSRHLQHLEDINNEIRKFKVLVTYNPSAAEMQLLCILRTILGYLSAEFVEKFLTVWLENVGGVPQLFSQNKFIRSDLAASGELIVKNIVPPMGDVGGQGVV